jgi:iron complex outermembrane receptor protein
MKRFHSASLCLLATVVCACPRLAAQAESTNGTPQNDQQVTRLDPFSVSAASESDYTLPDATTATKLDIPVVDTPVSVVVVPQQVLRDQQTLRLEDALQNVSGVLPNNDSGGTADTFTIRGFDANEMTYEDGLRLDEYMNSGFSIDMANVEQVEVAKGPASVLYGQSEPGGVVNIVTKQPQEAASVSLEQTFGSFDLYRATLDATGPLNASKTFLYRLNVAFEDDGSYREFVRSHRLILFPTLEWKPSWRTKLVLEMKTGSGYETYDPGIPFINGVVAAVPLNANFSEPGFQSSPTKDDSAKLVLTHHLTDTWTLKIAAKTGYISNPGYSVYYAGDPSPTGDLPRIGFIENFFKHWTDQGVVDLTGKFQTGFIRNTVIAGVDYYHDDGRYDANTVFPPDINIFAPVYGQPIAPPDPSADFTVFNGEKAFGAYAQDFAELPHGVFLLAGFRYDSATTYDTGYGVATSVHDHPSPTPRLGLLWQFVPSASVYASYTGNYGDTPLGNLTATGAFLPPESAQQYEAGIKSQWFEKRLTVTTGVYQVTKENIPATDPNNPIYSIAIGEARSRGVELDVSGQILPGWKVIGGYSYIDCVITNDVNTPSEQGLRFPNVPFNSGSVWTTYDVQTGNLKGLKLGLGIIARGSEIGLEAPNGTYISDRIPGFAVVNAMASYAWRTGKAKTSVQLNAENLANRGYFESVGYNTAYPGSPFAVECSLRIDY